MQNCEFVTFITILACSFANGKTTEELSLFSSFFTQFGDTLATLATLSSNNC